MEMGSVFFFFVIGIIFSYQVLVFINAEIHGFLNFGNGVCLSL